MMKLETIENTMPAYNNILQASVKTPLVKLERLSRSAGTAMYAKINFFSSELHFMDRMAIPIIEAAEKRGHLKPGGTIIETSDGDSGIGVAVASAIKGYKSIVVMPETAGETMVNRFRALGAEVVMTSTTGCQEPADVGYIEAEKLAREIPGAFMPRLYRKEKKPLVHYYATGPEILGDCPDTVGVFVSSMNDGGAITGAGTFLKEKSADITVIGSELNTTEIPDENKELILPGTVDGLFQKKTFKYNLVDQIIPVSIRDACNTARKLAKEEGIFAGIHSGSALSAALKYIRESVQRGSLVVMLSDSGSDYATSIYSDSWMKEHGLWEAEEFDRTLIKNILVGKRSAFPSIIAVEPGDTIVKTIYLMKRFNISQIPVIENETVLGSITETSLMMLLAGGVDYKNQAVGSVMGKPMPQLDEQASLVEAERVLLGSTAGVIITRKKMPIGVLTRADLIDTWVSSGKTVNTDYEI